MHNRMSPPYVSCVVPAYNEAGNIAEFIETLHNQLQELSDRFEIIVIDDCSADDTAAITMSIAEGFRTKLIRFSRNFGKETALSAGIDHAAGDVVVLIDADFQHPVEVIPQFLEKWREGFDMVYATQVDRDYMPTLRRKGSEFFYYMMNKVSKLELPPGAGDFRLLDRQVVEALKAMPERKRFMKGLYSWVGFKSIGVPYKVKERRAGQSQFNVRSLSSLALAGIISFSDIPLRIWSLIGFFVAFVSLIYAGWIVTETLLFGTDLGGWPTLIVAVTFLGGLQLMSIGVLGEYIAGIFNEVKQRPRYLIAQKHGFDDEEKKADKSAA